MGRVISARLVRLGFEQITLTSTAQHLNPPADAGIAVIDTEIQNARWRDDGIAPTAQVGMRLLADTEYRYNGGDLTAIQFVAEVAGSKLNVTYYG